MSSRSQERFGPRVRFLRHGSRRGHRSDGRSCAALRGGVAALFVRGGFPLPVCPTPLGIGTSVLIVILGALNLTLDFIERSAEAGAPRYMQWYGAFGLMVSLIWIYVSVLQLLV